MGPACRLRAPLLTMALTLGQWAAVAVLVATHSPNPNLIKAVDAELADARKDFTESCPVTSLEGEEAETHG